jgi:hypothetical protein
MATSHYFAAPDGTLFLRFANGDIEAQGRILHDPATALGLLERAMREQNRRHYTAAARLYARADAFVVWDDSPTNSEDAWQLLSSTLARP